MIGVTLVRTKKTKVKHLTAAVQQNNQELVHLFLSVGKDTGTGKHGDRGAMELAIQQDNVHLMNIMRKIIRNKRVNVISLNAVSVMVQSNVSNHNSGHS